MFLMGTVCVRRKFSAEIRDPLSHAVKVKAVLFGKGL
jgi:hypothetical protein